MASDPTAVGEAVLRAIHDGCALTVLVLDNGHFYVVLEGAGPPAGSTRHTAIDADLAQAIAQAEAEAGLLWALAERAAKNGD